MTTTRTIQTLSLLLAIALIVPLTGCLDGDDQQLEDQTHDETIQIAPGQGIEYKVFMEEGNELAYAWEADAPLFFDFHGEPEDAAPGAFTSHKTGDAPADQDDAFTAPFTGTHGWYWENQGDQTVTVDVHTEGAYRMVGVQ